jgi:hypothetical protein
VTHVARRLAAVASATLLGLAIAAPAHAQTYTRYDASADVTASTCDSTGDNCTDAIDASRKDIDIVRTKLTHSYRSVQAVASYTDISASGTKAYVVRIITNEGMRRHYSLVARGSTVLGTLLQRDSDGKAFACSGIKHAIDYTANTVTISIPRSCLSYPSTVRMGYGSADLSDDTRFYSDDALVNGVTASDADLVVGPKLARG